MRNDILITSVLVSLMVFAVGASASVSSITTSSSATSATTGTSVMITASITATSTESSSVSIITSPAGITVSDPSGGQYQSVSLSTTPTSKTFTITASAPNTYSYYVTSGGTPSTTETIIFVNPSTLTVTGSPSSTTKGSGETFTEAITISNPGSSAITTSYTLSCPSGFTCSGDPTSSTGTPIAAGSSTSLSWTVTVGGTSSSATLSLQLGDTSNAFTTSVTCSNCTTTTTTPGTTPGTTPSTSSAVYTVTTQKGKATISIPSITAGKSQIVNINKTEDVAITQVTVYVKSTVTKAEIVITKLAEKPSSITQDISGKVYHYIQVDKNASITDVVVNQTDIKFKVNKTWLTTNNVSDSTIALYRYENNAWTKLPTNKTGEDTSDVFYLSVSPGLSVFAISGVSGGVITPTGEAPSAEENVTAGGAQPTSKTWTALIIVVVLVIAAIVAFLIKSGKLGKISPKKSSWDDLKKKYKRA